MSLAFAFILDAPPSGGDFAWYWVRCALVPSAAICLEWLICRGEKRSLSALIGLCVTAALVVLRPAYDMIGWGYPFFPSWWFIAAPWIGAFLPFVAFSYFTLHPRKRLGLSASSRRAPIFRTEGWIRIAKVASALGLGWLFFHYWWSRVGAEVKFIGYWSLAAATICLMAIFVMRRLKHRGRNA